MHDDFDTDDKRLIVLGMDETRCGLSLDHIYVSRCCTSHDDYMKNEGFDWCFGCERWTVKVNSMLKFLGFWLFCEISLEKRGPSIPETFLLPVEAC